ncbi:MAG: Electron transfer flavoprotein alpha subunit [Firmicutes bacterium]|nr:Electron transfer flavoprotein alpha subunit [Bacillota bacterium]
MAGIWIYSEDIILAKELVTPAKELAKQAGQKVGAIALDAEGAKELAALGVTKVIVLQSSSSWVEAYEQVVADVLQEEGADIVLIGGTIRGKYTAAKAAARLDAGLLTDAVKVMLENNKLIAERFVYGGLAVTTEELSFPAFVTIPPRSYEIMTAESEQGEVIVKEVTAEPGITVVDVIKTQQQGVDISKADRVIGIGRGVEKLEDLTMIQALADAAGAEVGCTRPICEELKWMPIDRYIGISGQVIKGSLYIAVGTSGQIQHVAGIRDSKVIVAINTNEKEPIFTASDYGIVGDYADIVPALTEALQNAKA